MRKNSLLGVALAALALAAAPSGQAQPYSTAVQALNPAGYWPLTETVLPPQPLTMVATNSGTLGAAAIGYYGAWYQPSGSTWYITNNIVTTNGITGDGSQALACLRQPGQYVVVPRNTNGVPNPAVTITPPFSIEVWAYIGATTNGGNQTLVSEGQVPIIIGGSDPNNPYYGGTGTGWAGFALGQYQDYFYFSCFCTNAVQNKSSELDSSAYGKWQGVHIGDWVHVVATFDGNTESLYTNGVLAASKNVSANGAGLKYVPDPTSPLMIGNGNALPVTSGQNPFSGALDEVAIYPTVLTDAQIQAHYSALSSGYTGTVLADSPNFYYRFDDQQAPANAGYPSTTFPVANNLGSLGASANGIYQPGTTPGVAGPSYSGFGANSHAVAMNGFFGTVDVGGGNLPAALNPTNTAPFTILSWFRGSPADSPGRFQEIVGHGDSSYRLAMGNTASENRFNPGPGPEIQYYSADDVRTNGVALNDGKWHMVAGVLDGTNAYLYLDGVLARSSNVASGIIVTGNTNDLLLGGDSQYTTASATSANRIRNFDGSIAHVAFWTNALTAAQIGQIYGAAGVPPTIAVQPQPATVNQGSPLTLSVTARGSAPFTYQWYQNQNKVTGATDSSLVFNPIQPASAGNYFVVVNNSAGSVTSSVVSITVLAAPVIVQQTPTTVHVFNGTSPTLRVRATGPTPITYQWTLNGGNISGATSSSYTIPNIQSGGTYGCTVSNPNGSTPIAAISVSVLPAPTAAYPRAVLADAPLSYWRLDETGGTTAFDYADGLNGTYTNVVLNQPGYSTNDPAEVSASFGTASAVDSFAGNVSTLLDFGTPAGSSAAFSVEAWVNGGYGQTTAAGIATLGYGNGGEQFNLDTGSGVAYNFRFFVRDAAGAAHVLNGTTGPRDNNWHHVVGVCDQPNGKIYLYVDGMLNASGTLPAGTGILSLTTPLSIGSRQSGQGTAFDDQFVGNIDDVAIYPSALSAAQVANHYNASGVAPVITQQPVYTTVNENSTAYMSVTASGTAPLAYQWYNYTTGMPVTGQTNATLVISNVPASLSGNQFQVVITNLYGQVTSDPATLSVFTGPPQITADLQPLFAMGYAGTPFTYTVTAQGTEPFTYTWTRNGATIAGATGSSYSFLSQPGTNYYAVTVSSSSGNAVSSTATNIAVAVPTLNPADYAYKMKITFAGYNRAERLLNFPALVRLGTNLPGFAASQFASPDGGDLRFTDASGTREIPHEIDEWNPDGVSSIWVQVPVLSTNTDAIWAYWGNPAATTPLDWSTNGGVWVPAFNSSPAYKLVYHLKEGAFPFADSTQQHPATNGVAPGQIAGVVGTAGAFDGTDWLDAGTNDLDDALTLSAWVNVAPTAKNIQTIWANQHGGYGAPGFAWFVNTYNANGADQKIDFASGNGNGGGNESTTAAGTVSFGQWHLLEAAVNRTNGTVEFFLDGNDLGGSSSVVRDFTSLMDVNLGRFLDNNFFMTGAMDEARIQSGTASPNWVWADYMTVSANSAFENYSAINGTSAGVTITFQKSGGNLILNWPSGTLQSASAVNGSYTDLPAAKSPYSVPLNQAAQQFFRVKVQ